MATENPKLVKLRALFADSQVTGHSKPIQAYVLPRTDAHQVRGKSYESTHSTISERVHQRQGQPSPVPIRILGFERLHSDHRAGGSSLDGRPLLHSGMQTRLHMNKNLARLQAPKELEPGWKLMKQGQPDSVEPVDWITDNVPPSSSVGFDPSLFGYCECRTYSVPCS